MITGEIVRACSIDDCDRPVKAKGWCLRHYQRARAHGDPVRRDDTRDRIEDVQWMAETGATLDEIADRCGVSRRTMLKWLRANMRDLADLLLADRPGRLPVGTLRGADRG